MELKQYKERNEKELAAMWEEIALQLSKPKSDRPLHKEMYDLYGIPESTYYWTTSRRDFKQRIVENCLNEAKEWLPELVQVLKEKAIVDRSEKSIEMAFKYIAEVVDKIDHTTKGESLNITMVNYDNNPPPISAETVSNTLPPSNG